jgi:hypothetical protein
VTALLPAAPADDSTELDRVLEQNWETLARLVARGRSELARGRLERAAAAARVAATCAWFNHPGAFSCRGLELLVSDIGRRVTHQAAPRVVPGRVLHVATEVYATGGHTQMLAGWVAADGEREHVVCLTGQRGRPVPEKLSVALGARGRTVELDRTADGLVDRAVALRELAASAEVVVLHVHPDDVVPGLAFAPGRRPPGAVCLVNHADHVFWVGVGAADVVLDMRSSGAELTRTRRGVARQRQDLLTRPLSINRSRQASDRARAALGIPAGALVLATAAAGSKYRAVGGTGLLDVLGPLLERRPDVRLVAAGPEAEGEWLDLERRGGGKALGLMPSTAPLLDAADIYVDSYPFSSLTSMLEAAATGLPVVTLRDPCDGPAVLGADTPELDETLVVAGSACELRERVEALLDDGAARERLGHATRAGVETAHCDGAWVARAHRVLAAAALVRNGEPALPLTDQRSRSDLDRRVAQLQAQTGWGQHENGAALINAGFLPLGRRLALVAAELRAGRRPSARLLLSHRSARRLRRLVGRG